FAATAWLSTARIVDRYASEWTAMHDATCDLLPLTGRPAQEGLERRLACLAERRQQLSTLVTVFEGAGTGVVERAPGAAAALEGVTRCASPDADSRPLPPGQRHAADALRRAIEETQTLLDAGRYAKGKERAPGQLEQALALGDGPLEAEAR